jgi:hypothetical protein
MKWLKLSLLPLFAAGLLSSCVEDTAVAPERTELKADVDLRSVDHVMVWADCELFRSVVTPAQFDPESEPFDELYMNPDGFDNGVPLISESKPGDQDYNGGRWHLNVLNEDVDYSNACEFEDLDPQDFESTDMYFECPLLPSRGNAGGN